VKASARGVDHTNDLAAAAGGVFADGLGNRRKQAEWGRTPKRRNNKEVSIESTPSMGQDQEFYRSREKGGKRRQRSGSEKKPYITQHEFSLAHHKYCVSNVCERASTLETKSEGRKRNEKTQHKKSDTLREREEIEDDT
jgi:hypothetical protein